MSSIPESFTKETMLQNISQYLQFNQTLFLNVSGDQYNDTTFLNSSEDYDDGILFPNISQDLYYNDTLIHQLNYERRLFNIPVIVILFIIAIGGLFGNIFVIIIYSCFSPKSPANHFILLLALVDVINCTFCIPMQINSMWNPYFKVLLTLCRTHRFAESFTNLGSGLILVSVASERYCKICYPLIHYELKKAHHVSIVVVFILISMSWPQFFINENIIMEVGKDKVIGQHCAYGTKSPISYYVFLFHGLLYTVFGMAFCAFIFFYGSIVFVIIRRRRQIKEQSKSSTKRNSTKTTGSAFARQGRMSGKVRMKSSKTTLCLSTVTATVMLGYMPFLTIMILRTSGIALQETVTPDGEFFHYGSSAAIDLACTICVRSYFINCVINPIIYSIINPAFRLRTVTGFKRTLSKVNSHVFSPNVAQEMRLETNRLE